jgi:prepilin-type N-terminal cleavage/methylation domain-containing protein
MMPVADAKRFRLALIRRRDGFTLNEILVAIALIAIGVIGFSVNTVGVIQGNFMSGSFTIATNLAQDKLEELKAVGSYTDVTNSPDANNPITETGASGGRFTRTRTIATSSLNDATVGAIGSKLKEVSVTVSWSEYGTTRQVVVSTLVFQDAS